MFGCAGKTRQADNQDIAGTYSLVTVNSAKVPTTFQHEGVKVEVRSGGFTIRADGTCESKMVFIPPSGSEIARVVQATYTRQGSKLTMKWKGAGITSGTVQGDTFTMNNEDMILAYRHLNPGG